MTGVDDETRDMHVQADELSALLTSLQVHVTSRNDMWEADVCAAARHVAIAVARRLEKLPLDPRGLTPGPHP